MRRGFTLVEVLVALLIAAMLAMVAHRLFTAGLDGARTLAEHRAALDRQRNAERWLTAAFLSLDVGRAGFEGQTDVLRFETWVEAAGGWFERERVELGVRDGRLVALVASRPLVLADSVTAVAFDYLLDYGADERWATAWVSPLSAPIAVRMRCQRARRGAGATPAVDTTLYRIKARG